MQETLRVGVIGAGTMGGTHSRCWSRLPGARLVAIADRQTQKAEALAQRIAQTTGGEAAQIFASGEELIENGGVDVVSVCIPTPFHRSFTEAAAAAGKHVLCEKPMALTLDDCDAMIAATQKAGVAFTIGQCVRFFPEYAQGKRLVDSGAVGTPAAVRIRRGGDFPRTDTDWYADPSQSGGVLFDLMVHDLDWLRWCFGPVRRVYARGLVERLASKELDHLDYALVTLRHESGAISHAEGTWSDPAGFATAFEIAGDEGLLVHDSRKATVLTRASREVEGKAAGVAIPESPLFPEDDPYYREIEHFAQCIRSGEQPLVKPEEARAAVAIAVAARESIRTGKAVTVEA